MPCDVVQSGVDWAGASAYSVWSDRCLDVAASLSRRTVTHHYFRFTLPDRPRNRATFTPASRTDSPSYSSVHTDLRLPTLFVVFLARQLLQKNSDNAATRPFCDALFGAKYQYSVKAYRPRQEDFGLKMRSFPFNLTTLFALSS